MILIVDYGMGNIHSVEKALSTLGAKTKVSSQAKDLEKAEKIILPGVGAFRDAVEQLNKRGLSQALLKAAKNQKKILGICLGMQLFFEKSQEGGLAKGLGLMAGEIKKFSLGKKYRVPHIGWNQIHIQNKACPLLKGVKDGSFVYFCHSYYPLPKDKSVSSAFTDYGINFSSLVWKENIFGTQFHPEKSQKVGLKILENFIKC